MAKRTVDEETGVVGTLARQLGALPNSPGRTSGR